MSQHSIAEAYSALTSSPFKPRIHPVEALRIVDENLLASAKPRQPAARADGFTTLCYSAAPPRPSCDRVYTFNVRHFRAIAPPSLAEKICAP